MPGAGRGGLAVGAVLTALVALGQVSTSIYMPSLPSLSTALGATQQQASFTLGAFLLGFAPAQLLLGSLSDRFGRRPVLFAGLATYILASLGCALAPSIGALIAARFAQGMAACTGPVLSRAIVRDVYGPDRSATALAYIGAALAISPAVAPMIGGYLQMGFGWRAGFAFLVVFGVIVTVAAYRLLGETLPPPPDRRARGGMIAGYRGIVADRGFWAYVLVIAFVFSGLMAYTVGSPFVFINLLGLEPHEYGMLAIFPVAGYLAGSLAAGRLSRRVGIDRLLIVGLALCTIGGGGLAIATFAAGDSIVAILTPMALFTAGMGLCFAAGIAGAMAAFPYVAGAASALLGFVQMAVAGGTTTLFGAFEAATPRPMGLTVATCAVAAAVSYLLLRPRRGV